MIGGVNFLCEEEEEDEEIELLVDSNGLPITEFSGKYAAANTSSTMTKGWGVGVQTEITESIMALDNKFIIGGSADYGLTKFHQESFLATMTEDRTLLEKEGSFPFINFATFKPWFKNCVPALIICSCCNFCNIICGCIRLNICYFSKIIYCMRGMACATTYA